MKYRIRIDNEIDRDHLVAILTRNDYSVRAIREKVGTRYVRYVEYWIEEEQCPT